MAHSQNQNIQTNNPPIQQQEVMIENNNAAERFEVVQNRDTVLPVAITILKQSIQENYLTIWCVFILFLIVYYYWPSIKQLLPKPKEKELSRETIAEFDEGVRLARLKQQEAFLQESKEKIQELKAKEQKKQEEKISRLYPSSTLNTTSSSNSGSSKKEYNHLSGTGGGVSRFKSTRCNPSTSS